MPKVAAPFEQFVDIDGSPLESGNIYIGTSGLNAEASPITVYSDEARTVEVAQPIRTLGGLPVSGSSSISLYVAPSEYSIIIRNKNSSLVRSALTVKSDTAIAIDVVGRASNYVFSTVATMAAKTTIGGDIVTPVIGQKFSTQGRTSVNDGGQADYVVTNDAPNGYDIIDLGGGFSATLMPGDFIYVEAFGVSTSVSDNGPAHNACADYCRANEGTLTSRSNVIYTTDETIDFRSIKSVDYKAQITGTADFPTVLLGGDSNNTAQFYHQRVFKANRGGASPGVRLMGATKSRFEVGETSIFEIYADSDSSQAGAATYTAYNDIHVLSCTTFQINSNASTDGTSVQWINENRIFLRFCLYFRIIDNGYSHNSNQIFGGNFEAADSTIILETGAANTFTGIRGENALAITFGANASNNNVITDWFGFPNAPDAAVSVTDNGINNCVKNFNDISNDRIVVCGFNGSTLVHDSVTNKANILGVADSTVITAVAATNTCTAATFQTFYKSPLLEIFLNSQYFEVEVDPKLSGGIKMLINGWDSSMNSISNTGSDVFYEGATNETAGFGEENTTITNRASQRRIRILNTSAKYIEIDVKGSSAGCSFRRFTLFMVTSHVSGKKAAMCSVMVPNVT